MINKLKLIYIVILSLTVTNLQASQASGKVVYAKPNITCKLILPDLDRSLKCVNEKYTNRIIKIYTRHLIRNPYHTGEIIIAFSTNPQGKVKAIKITTKIKSVKLKTMLSTVSKNSKFPILSSKNNNFKYIFTAVK